MSLKLWNKLLQYIPLHYQAKFFIATRALSIIIKLVMLDQLFKYWFISYLPTTQNMVLEVTKFLDMVYLWNYGISFGFFQDYYKYSNFAFIVLNSLITLYLCFFVIKQKTVLSFYGYTLIIGGAVGNLVDRFVRGAVFDFISFHYEDIFWFPAFNFADSFVFIGVATILYDYYQIAKQNAKNKKTIGQKNNKFYDEFEEEAESIRNKEQNFKINN